MDAARTATAADVRAIAELASELRTELTPMRGGQLWSRREARADASAAAYGALLEDPGTVVAVGTIDDVVVGYGVCVIERLRDDTHLGTIPELFVTPEAREVGVGEQVIALLVAECRARGCLGIDTLALPGHRAAKNFFEGSGFTARAIVMHHALEP